MDEKKLTIIHGAGAEETPHAVDLFTRDDPRAVINLVPPALAAAILDCSRAAPELFELDEKNLRARIRDRGFPPTATDNRLRLAFWMEYDWAQTNVKNMRVEQIVAGVCSKQLFYSQYLKRPERVAWLLCLPVSYEVKLREGLDFGIDKLRDILDLPHTDEKGRINTKLLELQAKIVAMFDQRVKGAVVQTIHQKNMNLNVSTTDKQVAAAALGATMEDLDARIKELDRRDRASLNLPEPTLAIEVESKVLTEETDNG